MKHIIFIFLTILFLITPISLADDNLLYEDLEPFTYTNPVSSTDTSVVTYSKNICSLDRKTGLILYEKNSNEKVAIASTTKIMTCILALETLNLDKNPTYTISKSAASATGSVLGLKYNKTISLHDLLYGLMLRSGNDCAILIAEIISGDLENFSKLMNKKASELGLKNTHFVTPHGLDSDEHYSTAYDLAILTNYALKNDIFKKIVSTKKITIKLNEFYTEINNTNELLDIYPGIYGVKTGFTFNAGRCLVTAYKDDSFDIITVVLGADSKSIRSRDTKYVLKYIKENFKYINIEPIITNSFSSYQNIIKNHLILNKTTSKPDFYLEKLSNYYFPIKLDGNQKFSTKLYIQPKFSFKQPSNTIVGKLSIFNEYNFCSSLNIYLNNSLSKNTWNYYFFNILKNIKF